MLTGKTQNIYAKRKEKKKTQDGYPQAQEASAQEPSQEEVIINVGSVGNFQTGN
jgi:hypothetical protein